MSLFGLTLWSEMAIQLSLGALASTDRMSLMGQNAKYSSRTDVFRFGSELGHCPTAGVRLRPCHWAIFCNAFNLICPVYPLHLVRDFRFSEIFLDSRPKSSAYSSPSRPEVEGALAIVTDVGAGSGGRESCD